MNPHWYPDTTRRTWATDNYEPSRRSTLTPPSAHPSSSPFATDDPRLSPDATSFTQDASKPNHRPSTDLHFSPDSRPSTPFADSSTRLSPSQSRTRGPISDRYNPDSAEHSNPFSRAASRGHISDSRTRSIQLTHREYPRSPVPGPRSLLSRSRDLGSRTSPYDLRVFCRAFENDPVDDTETRGQRPHLSRLRNVQMIMTELGRSVNSRELGRGRRIIIPRPMNLREHSSMNARGAGATPGDRLRLLDRASRYEGALGRRTSERLAGRDANRRDPYGSWRMLERR